MHSPSVVPFIAFKGNWIYQYSLNVDPLPRKKTENSMGNLTKNGKPYSTFGVSARRMLMKTLTNWTLTQEIAHDQIGHPKATSLRNHTFVTLTLPYTQLHCDKVIKRECLNHFLININRQYQCKNYLWKAEVQRNGNIHFHILFDKYIPWREVRNLWNRCVNRLGYVDWFCTEHNHLDPNSTDIHALKKVKNIRAYIAKYVSKTVGSRDICGHAWGRSENLSKLRPFVIHEDYQARKWLDTLKENHKHTVYSNEHVGIIKFSEMPSLKEIPYHHYREIVEGVKENIALLS